MNLICLKKFGRYGPPYYITKTRQVLQTDFLRYKMKTNKIVKKEQQQQHESKNIFMITRQQ